MPNDLASRSKLFVDVTKRLPEIYLLVALLVCVALSVVTPPVWIPDECSHVQREMAIEQGEWMTRRTPEGVGTQIDVNYLALVHAIASLDDQVAAKTERTHIRPDHLLTEAELAPLRQIYWAKETRFSGFQNTAVYPPPLYLPQALALYWGRAGRGRIARTLLLARLSAAFCAIATGWLALTLSKSWRWLLFGYLLIPTLLNLNASCSQDALLLTVSALAMVVISGAVAERRELSVPELVLSAALLAMCIGARSPYLFLAGVLLLPVLELSGAFVWRRLLPSGVALAAVVAVVGVWQWSVHSLGLFSSPLAQPTVQAARLISHPISGLSHIAEGTIRILPSMMVKGMGLLGGNDVFPPHLLYGLLLLALTGVGIFAPRDGLRNGRSRLLLGLVLLGIVAAISLAEYVIWTPVGLARIDGLQSRYYLPLLPFALLLLPQARRSGRLRAAATMCSATVLVLVVLSMPWVAANRFYHSGLQTAVIAALR